MKTAKGAKDTVYPTHKDNQATIKEQKTPDDCFAEKARNWLWLLGVGVVGVIIYVIVALSGQHAVGSSTGVMPPQYGQVRNMAFNPQNGYQGGTLILELDMEVNASALQPGVSIRSIYVGGRAERAGLQPGDTICRFNGRRVEGLRQFQALVSRAAPLSSIRMQIIRNQRRINTAVWIGNANTPGVSIPNPINTVPGSPRGSVF